MQDDLEIQRQPRVSGLDHGEPSQLRQFTSESASTSESAQMNTQVGADAQSDAEIVERETQMLQSFNPNLEDRMRYDYALEHTCVAAAKLTRLHAEKLSHRLVSLVHDFKWLLCVRNILWSMPIELLETLVSSNIALEAANAESTVWRLYMDEATEWMHTANTVQAPLIYSIFLAATGTGRVKGSSPTAREWREVILLLRLYVSMNVSSHETAFAIDNAFRRHSEIYDIQNSRPYYLCRERGLLVLGRKEAVLVFAVLLSFSATGGGFNIHPPGLNNSSADTITAEVWAQYEQIRIDSGHWDENMAKDVATLRAEKQNPVDGGSAGKLGESQQARLQAMRQKLEALQIEVAAKKLERKNRLAAIHYNLETITNPELQEVCAEALEMMKKSMP
ncbi:hypothetical protein P3342_003071 [Pyrenophora teres f. teres]|nr:hypothetical protein P3342_003071 [Pyrenophora teres f. teres]